MLSDDQVRHIAKLARLGLKEEEVSKFSRQLSDILAYIQKLDEVDTTQVESTAQVTGLKNVMRKDEVKRFCEREDLLACSELSIVQEQIKVKPVITY